MSLTSITLIIFIALLLFGPEDLPVVAKTLGKIMYQVRRYSTEITQELQDAIEMPGNVIGQAIKDNPAEQKIKHSNSETEESNVLLTYTDETKLPANTQEIKLP